MEAPPGDTKYSTIDMVIILQYGVQDNIVSSFNCDQDTDVIFSYEDKVVSLC